MALVPKHHSKENTTINGITLFFFWFLSACKVMITLCCSLLSAICYVLKSNVLTLIKKYFIAKKSEPTSEPFMSPFLQ